MQIITLERQVLLFSLCKCLVSHGFWSQHSQNPLQLVVTVAEIVLSQPYPKVLYIGYYPNPISFTQLPHISSFSLVFAIKASIFNAIILSLVTFYSISFLTKRLTCAKTTHTSNVTISQFSFNMLLQRKPALNGSLILTLFVGKWFINRF